MKDGADRLSSLILRQPSILHSFRLFATAPIQWYVTKFLRRTQKK